MCFFTNLTHFHSYVHASSHLVSLYALTLRHSCHHTKTYEVLKEETHNPRIIWEYLPYSMHMAGPREAIQHMIIRKNYGMAL